MTYMYEVAEEGVVIAMHGKGRHKRRFCPLPKAPNAEIRAQGTSAS